VDRVLIANARQARFSIATKHWIRYGQGTSCRSTSTADFGGNAWKLAPGG